MRQATKEIHAMNVLRLFPVVLSALLLGAHFLRAGLIPVVIPALLFPALLFFRRAWTTRLVQIILVLGALEWVRTLVIFVNERYAAGQPWGRLVMIIGLVASLTGGSALLIGKVHSEPRRKYSGPGSPPGNL